MNDRPCALAPHTALPLELCASVATPPPPIPPLPPVTPCSDYRPMEHLDRYEGDGIDDGYVDDITEEERFAARLAAERELAERDLVEGRLTGRRRGLPAALEGACAAWAPPGCLASRAAAAPVVLRGSCTACTVHGFGRPCSCRTACPRMPLPTGLVAPCRGAGRR